MVSREQLPGRACQRSRSALAPEQYRWMLPCVVSMPTSGACSAVWLKLRVHESKATTLRTLGKTQLLTQEISCSVILLLIGWLVFVYLLCCL